MTDAHLEERKPPCLYPLPDGRRCCECDACHATKPLSKEPTRLSRPLVWDDEESRYRTMTVEDITPEKWTHVRHVMVMEFGKCSHVSVDRVLAEVLR